MITGYRILNLYVQYSSYLKTLSDIKIMFMSWHFIPSYKLYVKLILNSDICRPSILCTVYTLLPSHINPITHASLDILTKHISKSNSVQFLFTFHLFFFSDETFKFLCGDLNRNVPIGWSIWILDWWWFFCEESLYKCCLGNLLWQITVFSHFQVPSYITLLG